MTTTSAPSRPDSPPSWGGRGAKTDSRARLARMIPRRRLPHLVLGLLLVVGCATGGVVIASQLGDRVTVLALAQPVTVGQVLSAADVHQISISTDTGLDVIGADELSTVVGQSVAFSLPQGSLLTRAALGSPQIPPAGQAIAAVGLKPGQFPPELAVGTRVAVMVRPDAQVPGDAAPTSSWTAVVSGVQRADVEQITVVSLHLGERDARELASAPEGQVRMVALNGGER